MTELTKEDMWQAWREATNREGSMTHMTDLEERTAKKSFENWWEQNYE